MIRLKLFETSFKLNSNGQVTVDARELHLEM